MTHTYFKVVYCVHTVGNVSCSSVWERWTRK